MLKCVKSGNVVLAPPNNFSEKLCKTNNFSKKLYKTNNFSKKLCKTLAQPFSKVDIWLHLF